MFTRAQLESLAVDAMPVRLLARGGAFVTVDADGISDVGVRGQVSGSVSAGPLGANVSTSSDISLIPSVEVPNAATLP